MIILEAPNAIQIERVVQTARTKSHPTTTSSIVLPNKTTRRSRNLRVNFRATQETFVQVRLIPNRDDITKEELRQQHMTTTEFTMIKQRERRLSRQLSRLGALVCDFHDDDEMGLESTQMKSKRKLRQQESCMAVLLEQSLQADAKEYNPEYVADIYGHFARKSQLLAYERGLRNAEHVKIQAFYDAQPPTNTPTNTIISSSTSSGSSSNKPNNFAANMTKFFVPSPTTSFGGHNIMVMTS